MIPRAVFYDRLENHCKTCSEWEGVCLRGHALQSQTGCPLRKFDPIEAAAFDEDKGRVIQPPATGGCSGCGAPVSAAALPELSWSHVLSDLGQSIGQWRNAGMPLATGAEHEARYAICQVCPHFSGYRCLLCRCVIYAKSKLATAYCPIGKW